MVDALARRTLALGGSRALMLLVPVTDTLVLGTAAFERVGSFSVVTLLVQVFVVFANGLFVGNYVEGPGTGRSARPTLALALGAGALAALILLLLALVAPPGSAPILLVAATGMVPLFLFAGVTSLLESSGRERLVFRLSTAVVGLNMVLSIGLVRVTADPAVGVMAATSIARTVLGLAGLYLIRREWAGTGASALRGALRVLIDKGFPEGVTRSLFVLALAASMGFAETRLSPPALSAAGVVLTYMNFLFVVGVAVTLAAAVDLSGGRGRGWFLRYGALALVALVGVGLGLAPVVAIPFGAAQAYLFPAIFHGVVAVGFDAAANHVLMALRAEGPVRLRAFIRLVMFPPLCGALLLPGADAATLFLAMALGNALVFALVALSARLPPQALRRA